MFYQKKENQYRNPLPGVTYKTLVHGDKSSLSEFHLEKGSTIPKHSHHHEQTGYMVSGRMIFTIEGKDYETLPGNSWCISSNVEHSVEVLEDSVVIEVFSPVREEYL